MISLSSILQMRHGLSKKKEKDGMPKKHDPKNKKTEKNGHINVHEKKEKKEKKKKIYIYSQALMLSK